jgi:hypothetical protein
MPDIAGTISASHLEVASTDFLVRIHRMRSLVQVWRVQAQTPRGALRVARYHFSASQLMEVLGADGAVVLDDAQERAEDLRWTFDGMSSDFDHQVQANVTRTMTQQPMKDLPPAASALCERLTSLGFTVTCEPRLTRCRTTIGSGEPTTTYGTWVRVEAVRGDHQMSLVVRSSGHVDPPTAIQAAVAEPGTVRPAPTEPPIFGGLGQRVRSRDRAVALLRATSDVADLVLGFEIGYETRAGRGGFRTKVARSSWKPADLQAMLSASA